MTIDFSLLPNFFLIGAAKAGTTTLHDVLRQHPQIFCSQVKETGFFITEDRWSKGVEWYQQTHFSRAAGYPKRSESTAVYLLFSEVVAPRIHDIYGKHPLQFLAILRDPVKRAYSHYWQRIHTGLETLPFEEALEKEEQRLRESLGAAFDSQAAGQYLDQLSADQLIQRAGGRAFLAHPLVLEADLEELDALVGELKSKGLDGLEAIYAPFTESQRHSLIDLANKHDLLVSAGHEPSGKTTLYDGREWRIHYWLFRKERIFQLINTGVGDGICEANDYDCYADPSTWQRTN